MADIAYNIERSALLDTRQATIVKWADIGKDEVGISWISGEYTDKTVHILGNFSDSTVTIEGTNESTPSNFVILTDPQGNPISKVVAAIEAITESPLYLRPKVSGGTTPSVTVIIVAKKNKR